MDSTSPVATAPAQTASAMPTASVPSAAPSQGMSPVSTSPASMAQAVAPQVAAQPQAYQPQAAPQASVAAPSQAGNPWQEAFQALSASLNTSSPSPAQVSPWGTPAQATPTPQAATQVSFPHSRFRRPDLRSPSFNPAAGLPGPGAAAGDGRASRPAASAPAAESVDSYLSQISDQSLEVLQHFGAEAPALLNTYACAVEDALIEQVQRANDQSLVLEAAGEERAAMNTMLTNPDVLADYVNEFFGPEGPYPTPTEAEQAEMNAIAQRQQLEAEIAAQQANQVPAAFQRPVMDMPAPERQAQSGSGDFWGGFSELMDSNPEQAWQFLSQASVRPAEQAPGSGQLMANWSSGCD